jgi:hypothetical protein
MDIEETLKLERERNEFLQWKCNCWRNLAVLLANSIKSNNPLNLEKVLAEFEIIKKLFPYEEI